MYDPRFRPYYVEVLTPIPKDLVIVFDKSESMNNENKLQLSQKAAQTVVDTLNPNDRVALVLFSSDASTPAGTSEETCYSSQMAFATPIVKNYFNDYLKEKIFPMGNTDYKKALQKAFQILKTVKNQPDRQKVIIFLTDGSPSHGSQSILELLSTLNAEQNNRVLILTYGLGTDVGDGKDLLQDMANMTVYNKSAGDRIKGHFEHILHTTELRTKLGSYYNYFSGIATLPSPIVSVPYTDFSGLGHIFSVCLPVKNSTNHLKGTVCSDIQLKDIKDYYNFIEDDTVHAFIIDKTGRTLVHPLLPSPGLDARSDPLFVNIKVLEPDAEKSGIIDAMKKLVSVPDNQVTTGNKSIERTVIVNRGNPELDGVKDEKEIAHYFWTKIPGTHFSVCLVISENAQNITITESLYAQDVMYHLMNISGKLLVNQDIFCEHYNEIVTKEDTTIQFSEKVFNRHEKQTEDNTYVTNINRYLSGKINGEIFDFKPDIRTSVAIMAKVESKWKTSFKPYIEKKFVATYHGIYQVYPGRQIDQSYDATESEWFKKAKSNLQAITLMASNNVITLAKSLLKSRNNVHTENDKIWAVMGMDVTTHYVRTLISSQVTECQSGQYKCLLMDSNGYLLYHPDVRNDLNVHPIPIADALPDIALSLRRKNILISNDCTDYAWKKHYYTWKVKYLAPSVNNLKEYPPYFFTPIDSTNVYLIYMPANFTGYINCYSCGETTTFLHTYECYNFEKCYCPCFSSAKYQHCLNEFKITGSQDKPCLKSGNTVTAVSQLLAQDLPQCFSYRCESITDTDQCGLYSDCKWCHSTRYMNDMGCRLTSQCYTGLPHLSEVATDTNLVPILVPIFILLLVAAIVIVLVIYMYRKQINPFTKCYAAPDVKADNHYTDIPINGAPITRQPQQHHEGPYSISNPVGLVNYAFSNGGRQPSVASLTRTGSSGGTFTPEVRYVNPENGKITQQPVLIIPVQMPSRTDQDNSIQTQELNNSTPYMLMNANGLLGATERMVTLQPTENQTSISQTDSISNISQSNTEAYYEPIENPEYYASEQPANRPPIENLQDYVSPEPANGPPPLPPPNPPNRLNSPYQNTERVVPHEVTDNNVHNRIPRHSIPVEVSSEGTNSLPSSHNTSRGRITHSDYLTTGVLLDNNRKSEYV